MEEQLKALRLADELEMWTLGEPAAEELRRLVHNNEVLMNALMKACGDDEQVVKDYIESQGELR